MRKQTLKKIIVVAFLAAVVFAAVLMSDPSPLSDHSCCHVSAQGQDPPPEEEGNPGHKEPTASCNHKPKGEQVACRCRRMENCEEKDGSPREHIACKSYCFPTYCTCPVMPCP